MDCILVADVDLWAVEAVSRAANGVGLRVVIAENGIEALEHARAEQPRIILVDRLLPVLDGVQVCEKIRESVAGPATALFLTGAMLDDDGAAICRRLRLSGVLEKPLRADDIEAAIAPFLREPDAATSEPSGPRSTTACDVNENPISRVLVDLAASPRSGQVIWRSGRLVKSLYLDDGDIVACASNGSRDQWPAWAQRDPGFAPENRSRLAAVAVPGPAGAVSWAEYLENRGVLTVAEYEYSMARRLVSIAVELLAVATGTVDFVEGVRPPRSEGRIDARQLTFHGLRGATGKPFGALLPGPAGRLRPNVGREALRELQLTQAEQQIFNLIDGEHTLGDILALARLIQKDVRPFLYGLIGLGMVEPGSTPEPTLAVDRAESIGERALPRKGSLREHHIGRLLATITASGLTGIVQLRRADSQTAIHIAGGQIVFARSNQPAHRLGRVLLEERKITREDHARALAVQSVQRERRIGAILLALGALSLKELHEGLCAQVRGIIGDAFHWRGGDYAFIAGRLPTDDMVSLGTSTPNLLLECFRALDIDAVDPVHFPVADTYLIRLWDAERCDRLLTLVPAEEAVLSAAHAGWRVGELIEAGDERPQTLRSLLGLLAIGCLAVSVRSRPTAPRREPEEVEASASAPEDAAVDDGLRSRMRELEAENERLRKLLTTSETVLVR